MAKSDYFNPVNVSILVVDDDESSIQIMKFMLNNLGFKNLFTAKNGAEAQEIFKKKEMDIVICDIAMPTMNGIELFKFMLEWITVLNSGNLRFMFYTAFNDFDHVQKVRQIAATFLNQIQFKLEFIVKPVNIEQLIMKIQNLFSDDPKMLAYLKTQMIKIARKSIDVDPEGKIQIHYYTLASNEITIEGYIDKELSKYMMKKVTGLLYRLQYKRVIFNILGVKSPENDLMVVAFNLIFSCLSAQKKCCFIGLPRDVVENIINGKFENLPSDLFRNVRTEDITKHFIKSADCKTCEISKTCDVKIYESQSKSAT